MSTLIKAGIIGAIFTIGSASIVMVYNLFNLFLDILYSIPFLSILYIFSVIYIFGFYILIGLGFIGTFKHTSHINGHGTFLIPAIILILMSIIQSIFTGFHVSSTGEMLEFPNWILNLVYIMVGVLILCLKLEFKGKILPAIFLIAAGGIIFWESLDIFSLQNIIPEQIYWIVIGSASIIRAIGLYIFFRKSNKYSAY